MIYPCFMFNSVSMFQSKWDGSTSDRLFHLTCSKFGSVGRDCRQSSFINEWVRETDNASNPLSSALSVITSISLFIGMAGMVNIRWVNLKVQRKRIIWLYHARVILKVSTSTKMLLIWFLLYSYGLFSFQCPITTGTLFVLAGMVSIFKDGDRRFSVTCCRMATQWALPILVAFNILYPKYI